MTLQDSDGWRLEELTLRYEGTYGSEEFLPSEYFVVTRPASKSALGKGSLKVQISYSRGKAGAQVAGFNLHGNFGVCTDVKVGKAACDKEIETSEKQVARFDKGRFYYSDGSVDNFFLPKGGGTVPSGKEEPFCKPDKDLENFADAVCLVTFGDVYEPIKDWWVLVKALDTKQNYQSASNFSIASFDKEDPDGNGIYLTKKPACVEDKSCVIFTGRVKYWRGKSKAYFAVEIKLKDDKPESAILHSLKAYEGGVR